MSARDELENKKQSELTGEEHIALSIYCLSDVLSEFMDSILSEDEEEEEGEGD